MALLFDALNPKRMAQCILCPSELINIMLATYLVSLEAPSIYRVHCSTCLFIGTKFSFSLTPTAFAASVLLVILVTSTVLEYVNSTIKSTKACPFIVVRGKKFTSNCPNLIPHLRSLLRLLAFVALNVVHTWLRPRLGVRESMMRP